MIIFRGLLFAFALLLCLFPAEAQKAGISEHSGFVAETQTAQLQQQKEVGSGVNVGKLGTVKELTPNECTRLGCTLVNDRTCPGIGFAKLTKWRCVCQGGGSLCIDKLNPK